MHGRCPAVFECPPPGLGTWTRRDVVSPTTSEYFGQRRSIALYLILEAADLYTADYYFRPPADRCPPTSTVPTRAKAACVSSACR
jgi:hypothetical protein